MLKILSGVPILVSVSGPIPTFLQVFVLIKNAPILRTYTAYMLGVVISASVAQVTEILKIYL